MEADQTSDRETENVYSSTYNKLSNMWGKHISVYVEWLRATNAHKSKDYRTAHQLLRNNGYIEW